MNTCNGRVSISPLSMAGFGGGGGGSSKKKGGNKKNKSKAKPLKPKSQWDKYKSLKEATSVKVAARTVTEGNDGEWHEVGKVKSEEDKLTELAVFMQRGIITEVSDFSDCWLKRHFKNESYSLPRKEIRGGKCYA